MDNYLVIDGYISIPEPSLGYDMDEEELKQQSVSYSVYNLVLDDIPDRMDNGCINTDGWEEEWYEDADFYDYVSDYVSGLIDKDALQILKIRFDLYEEDGNRGYDYICTLKVDVSELWDKYQAEKTEE